MTVRTRVAPSPTGDPHLGTAYVGLFNWAFARRNGGELILRIEDTDRARSSVASESRILSALAWLGLDWDEGPDKGGPHGPYRQSERLNHYRQAADRLLAAGRAFRCFCTPERLAALRARQRGQSTGYDGACLNLGDAEVAARMAAGEPSVLRMRVPDGGECRFHDELRGAISIPWNRIDMQVLQKADGYPTYHLAVVVDDHLMRISHILRGEEWLSSVPKHRLLADYLGFELPRMAHLPLLRNPDRSKLSKRRNPTSLDYFRRAGYLPEALLNYLGLMGYAMPDEATLFSPEALVQAFDLERISLGGAAFDLKKLNWMNGQYLRQLDPDAFVDRLQAWGFDRAQLLRLAPLVQARSERLADVVPQAAYLLGERPPLAAADFEHRKLDRDQVVEVLFRASRALEALEDWSAPALKRACRDVATQMQLDLRVCLFPLFIAVAGKPVALPLFDSMALLGPELTRMRLQDGLKALEVSGKALKRLEKLTG